MSAKQEKKINSLINHVVEVMDKLHALEATFSRLKNESTELLRELSVKKDG